MGKGQRVNLLAELRRKTAALAKARGVVMRLETELDRLGEVIEKAKPVPPPTRLIGRRARPAGSTGRPRGLPFVPTSSVGLAHALYREAGKPLHIDQVVRELHERGHKDVKRETLIGNLARYVKRGVIFARFAPNVYGLKEWEGTM